MSNDSDRFVVGLFDEASEAQTVVKQLEAHHFSSDHINTIDSNSRSGLTSYLQKHGVPQTHADFYAEGVRRHGTLVTLFADDSKYAAAVELMRNHGAVDINKRASYLKKQGFTKYDENAETYAADKVAAERSEYAKHDHAGEQVLQEMEEKIHIGKEKVERGGVRVFARMVEVPVEKHVTLRDETIHVDRQNVDRAATSADLDAFKEGEVTLTETDERAVVSKEARVTGEVRVGKTVEEKEQVVTEKARKTEVDVEKIEAGAVKK